MSSTQQSRRKKIIPTAPPPVSEQIRRHFKSLVAQIDGGCLNNALKTCDKILRLSANDPDALQTKLVLFLQTDQYGAALSWAETILLDKQLANFSTRFAKAYALYRLNRESEAAEFVRSIRPDRGFEERGVLHMEAQIEYRLGHYRKSQELYSHFFDTSVPESDEQTDSLTNLNASQTHLDFLQSGYLRSLHSFPQSVLNSIEETPPPSIVASHHISTSGPSGITTQVSTSLQKQPRKSRLPKTYVPGITPPPDPERWIKKSERTNVNQGGKRRKGTSAITQGSVVEISSKANSGKGKKRK